MIKFYDAHTHLFPEERMGGLMRWIHRAVMDFSVPADITAEQAVADLRTSGAVAWANLLFPLSPGEARELHAWGYELAERFPEIIPFGGVHIDDTDPFAIVKEAAEKYQMAGFKFHPMVQRFYPWEHHLARVLSYLNEREMPIYVHTGYEERYNHHYDRVGLETMLTVYPRLPVVLAHIGFPELEWAFTLADRYPQVWLDLTNVPGSMLAAGLTTTLSVTLNKGVRRHMDRALMGTDYPAGMGTISEILSQYREAGIDDDVLEHMMLVSTRKYFERFGSR